ncbi:MAG: hypothetical protein PHH24_00440 [Candidatus Moranbacteria bacterium]|jgi:hypothetical protein|nr:hypothetical protein [Candidatus Moranbacteria bacterium]MDX9855700.1 hypothetical protein [Candidatus Moranbacteria bacterium]
MANLNPDNPGFNQDNNMEDGIDFGMEKKYLENRLDDISFFSEKDKENIIFSLEKIIKGSERGKESEKINSIKKIEDVNKAIDMLINYHYILISNGNIEKPEIKEKIAQYAKELENLLEIKLDGAGKSKDIINYQ